MVSSAKKISTKFHYVYPSGLRWVFGPRLRLGFHCRFTVPLRGAHGRGNMGDVGYSARRGTVDGLLDLGLDVGGLPAAAVPVVERALGEGDLALLALGVGETASLTKVMRESHHQLARLVARGLKGAEIAAITGFSQCRISVLKGDPAFCELVEHYREVEDSAFADVAGQIAAFGLDVLGELRDRLEASPEQFRNRELLEVFDSMMDRTGMGRSQKVQAEVVHVTGEQLLKLKELAKEVQDGRIYNNQGLGGREAVALPAPEAGAPEGGGVDVGGVGRTGAKASEAAAEGEPGKGTGV